MTRRTSEWNIKAARWMMGRYGIDEMTQGLMIFGCLLVVVNFFAGASLLALLSFVAMGYALFRSFSRNIEARQVELSAYRRLMETPKKWWRRANVRWANRSTTLYFTCKGCGAELSVPRGKGKIRVTCPRCGQQTDRRS